MYWTFMYAVEKVREEVNSARPHAPVVDDGRGPGGRKARRLSAVRSAAPRRRLRHRPEPATTC